MVIESLTSLRMQVYMQVCIHVSIIRFPSLLPLPSARHGASLRGQRLRCDRRISRNERRVRMHVLAIPVVSIGSGSEVGMMMMVICVCCSCSSSWADPDHRRVCRPWSVWTLLRWTRGATDISAYRCHVTWVAKPRFFPLPTTSPVGHGKTSDRDEVPSSSLVNMGDGDVVRQDTMLLLLRRRRRV